MAKLSLIQDTIQQVAEAITAALEIETEIVDETLQIIGGTGRYLRKIGQYEEEGELNSTYIYAKLLNNGASYITVDPLMDPRYHALEGELAEICCPIKLENKILGLIGLVAFNEEQRDKIKTKRENLTSFLEIMAELIASRFLTEINNDTLKEQLNSVINLSPVSSGFEQIIGESSAMQKLKKRALQISHSDSTVLITGESGTGKDLFARAIHNASPRSDKPFISINCGAIPEMLLESELFGYEKGAFTGADKNGKIGKFELANHGTIFLDEIGDMPLHLQVKLLRIIQNKQIDKVGGYAPIDVDVRIIAATNKNLEEMIVQNSFREDLYFRLSVIPLLIPPLRERPEDISSLLEFSFQKFNEKLDKKIAGISAQALDCLCSYSWPGNARELENAMEFAINMETSSRIQIDNLPDKVRYHGNHLTSGNTGLFDGSHVLSSGKFKSQTLDYQKQLVVNCLNQTGWDLKGKQKAAEILNISLSTLYIRLREMKKQ